MVEEKGRDCNEERAGKWLHYRKPNLAPLCTRANQTVSGPRISCIFTTLALISSLNVTHVRLQKVASSSSHCWSESMILHLCCFGSESCFNLTTLSNEIRCSPTCSSMRDVCRIAVPNGWTSRSLFSLVHAFWVLRIPTCLCSPLLGE